MFLRRPMKPCQPVLWVIEVQTSLNCINPAAAASGAFQTQDPLFLSTSSAWGVMEGAVRNLCAKKTLCCMCGAFSDKWLDVAQRCGKEADGLEAEWGHHIDPQILDSKLSTGEYDLVTLVHNETSCGMMNPLEDIMKVLAKYPDVISVIDTVSSFSVVPIPKDLWGIDVILTGSQKHSHCHLGFCSRFRKELLPGQKRLMVVDIILISSNF